MTSRHARFTLVPRTITALTVVSILIAGAACGRGSPDARTKTTKSLDIVYFASATANGFSQAVWRGMQIEAQRLGGKITLHILDGNFSATTQVNQVQDAAVSRKYDGAVLLANDTVGIVPAVKTLIKSGVVVSNVLNPLGPDLESLKPQVNGLLSVIAAPAYDTTLQAQQVVTFCQHLNPCRVVILIGGLQFPFDKERYNAYRKVLDAQPNINVLATGQGSYDRDKALTAMSDILQAHPKFDVLLSGSDQETAGALIALSRSGGDVSAMVSSGHLFIDSLGGDQEAVAAVRAGKWNLTVGNFPETAGRLAIDQVVNKIRGKHTSETVNIDEVAPVPLVLTADVLKQHPDFRGEWSG